MSLIPWRPTTTLDTRFRALQDEMNSLFSSMFRPLGEPGATSDTALWTPTVDVRDNDKFVIVTADLPGIPKADVQVETTADSVTIRGERRAEKTEKGDNYWRREISTGTFMRRIALPAEVDASHAEAKMDNGVLTINLPKAPASKGKTLKIA